MLRSIFYSFFCIDILAGYDHLFYFHYFKFFSDNKVLHKTTIVTLNYWITLIFLLVMVLCLIQKIGRSQGISNVIFSIKLVNDWKPLTIFTKSSILDVLLSSGYASQYIKVKQNKKQKKILKNKQSFVRFCYNNFVLILVLE